ncbi:MAG: GDSL-type esterase/lipase family protein [Thermodesulfobacteriota bacterium]|nr:GDSL-type esterase/lipase family protein [Thermodesulfobacteriota bacterium]
MGKPIKSLNLLLTSLILLFAILIISIIWTGGFEVHIFGKEISCNAITNPVLALTLLILFRVFLKIGWANSVTLFVSLLIFSILAEGFLMIFDSPLSLPTLKNITQPSHILGYQLVPSLRGRKIQINSHGLRDRERSWEKPSSINRILGLGDSFTFGYGVNLEDCYLKQLEGLLNYDKTEWDVINAGVVGYDMWQYLAYFEHYGYLYHPDLVTIGVYFNDFYGNPSHEEAPPQIQRYRSLSSLSLVNFVRNCFDILIHRYRYLQDASWLRSLEDRREYILNGKRNFVLRGEAAPELYREFEARLRTITILASEHGARVLVILIPDVVQLNYIELQGINHILKQICDRCNVDYLDITPFFESVKDIKDLYMLPQDAHTSPAGHRIIAREMEKRIVLMMKDRKSMKSSVLN